MILDILSAILIIAGLLFFLGGVLGLVRFPDFYTRMHAAGKGDTLSTMLITAGLALQLLQGFDLAHWTEILVAAKVLAIGIFIMLTSPTSTHALMKAGYDEGIEPVTKPGNKGIRDLGGPFLDGVEPAPAPRKRPASKKKASAKKAPRKKAATKKKTPSKKVAAKKKTSAKKAARKKVPAKKKSARKSAAAKKTGRRKGEGS